MDLKELESGVDPKTHWYYQSKMIPLVKYVRKVFIKNKIPLTLIDVGSGSGFFMYELLELVPEMIQKIYLVDIGYTTDEIKSTQDQLVEKTTAIPQKIGHAIVVMMDVLEHLESDTEMLRAIRRNATGGRTHFFITVPAFMGLWSGHDIYLGHYRRYTLSTLKQLLAGAAIKSQSTYYIYGTIFPLVWIARKFSKNTGNPKSDMKPAGLITNGALKIICSLEMPFRKLNKLAGVSVVAEGTL